MADSSDNKFKCGNTTMALHVYSLYNELNNQNTIANNHSIECINENNLNIKIWNLSR